MNSLPDSQKNPYPVELKKVEDLLGFAINTCVKGDTAQILRKGFITSYKAEESNMMGHAVRLFVSNCNTLNTLLVVVRDGEARIYRQFPLISIMRLKTEVQQYQAVSQDQILDIVGVEFKDSTFTLDVKDGDKFLWLHRSGWNFGLYFDFSGKLEVKKLTQELGYCLRNLEYYSVYEAFASSSSKELLIKRGWFPFAQLLGGPLEVIIRSNNDKFEQTEKYIVSLFDEKAVNKFTNNWWKNPLFENKKLLLEAGIQSFLKNTDLDNISCIKTLTSEIEGILQYDFYEKHGKRPSVRHLKEHIVSRASDNFGDVGSLGFPGLFNDYLETVFFKDFDIQKGEVDLSRHSVSHGTANAESYTRVKALQCLLVLDQIYFYVSRSGEDSDEETSAD